MKSLRICIGRCSMYGVVVHIKSTSANDVRFRKVQLAAGLV